MGLTKKDAFRGTLSALAIAVSLYDTSGAPVRDTQSSAYKEYRVAVAEQEWIRSFTSHFPSEGQPKFIVNYADSIDARVQQIKALPELVRYEQAVKEHKDAASLGLDLVGMILAWSYFMVPFLKRGE